MREASTVNQVFEQTVVEHAVWKTAFAKACREGQIARRDFQLFYAAFAPHIAAFDRLIAAVLAATDDAEARALLRRAATGWLDTVSTGLAALRASLGVGPTDREGAGARLADDCLRLCSGDGIDAASALAFGVIRPFVMLQRLLLEPLARLSVADAALAFVRDDAGAILSALHAVLATADNGALHRACRVVDASLDAHEHFLDAVFRGMQLAGLTSMLTAIQERKSLACVDDILAFRKGEAGVPLYSNRIDNHQILFSVASLPFRPEVLEPRIVRIPPRKNNERHRHAHETVFLIIEGEARIVVDERAVDAKPGDIVFVPRWAMHQSQNTGDSELRILAVTDFGLTGKTFIGDYSKSTRMLHNEQSGAANWRALRGESKATEDFLAPLSVAYGTDPEIWGDPYPLYDKARQQAPVYFSERFGAWFVTSYAEVAGALRDLRLSSRRADEKFRGLDDPIRVRMEAFRDQMRSWLPFMDPPDHTRIRSRLNRFFTTGACEELRPRMAMIVDELMAKMTSNGGGDIIWNLASPLHFILVCEMLFGRELDREQLKAWGTEVWAFVGAGAPTAERAERAAAAWSEMTAYLRDEVVRRRCAPGNDIVSALFVPDASGDVLSDDEVTATCVLMLSVGHEATWDTIGNSVLTLLRHPELASTIRDNPNVVEDAVEELLRYESPVQICARKAKEPITVGGKQIETNDFMFLMIGAANRDPLQFPEPTRIDFYREGRKSLATGLGIHHCIGGPLGKIEAQVVISRITTRWPELRLVPESLRWKASLGLRGVQFLPVTLG